MRSSKTSSTCSRRALAAALVLVAASPPAAHAQGVTVALIPATQTVAPGDTFSLTIQVTQAGSHFNAFDAYVGWDPAALTFIPLSPTSLQEGGYFKSGCSNRFHLFKQGADRDTITDVLLCSGISLTGPGAIYRLKFRASTTPQVTNVRFLPGLRFYNDGVYVNPVNSTDAAVGIGVAAGVVDPTRSVPATRMRVSPNPARAGATFAIDAARAGKQELVIRDLQGRTIRVLERGLFPKGSRVAHWDGRNELGARVRPGIYLGSLQAPPETVITRFTVVN